MIIIMLSINKRYTAYTTNMQSLSVCCNQFVPTNTLIHRHNTIVNFVHQATSIKQRRVIVLIIGGSQNLIITFRSEMYSDRACLCACVCLCVSVPRCMPTLLHVHGCNLGNNWGICNRCMGFVAMATYAPNAKCQRVPLYSLYGCCLLYTSDAADE